MLYFILVAVTYCTYIFSITYYNVLYENFEVLFQYSHSVRTSFGEYLDKNKNCIYARLKNIIKLYNIKCFVFCDLSYLH